MAEAGADVLVPHMGLTTGGAIGAATAKTLDESSSSSRRCATRRRRSTPTSSCSATAARSPSPRTPPTSSSARRRRRLLRRLEHGAAADRDRDDREHAPVQGDLDVVGPSPVPRRRDVGISSGGERWRMSRFVMASDVRQEQFDWGHDGLACTRRSPARSRSPWSTWRSTRASGTPSTSTPTRRR